MNTKLTIFCISLILFACQRDYNVISPKNEYNFNAIVGNEEWQGDCYLDFANANYQNLFLSPNNNYNYIRVKFNFNGIGEYILNDSCAALEETIGGDVHFGTYYSYSNIDDKLVISHYDKTEKTITGLLNFKLKKDSTIIRVNSDFYNAWFINQN